MIEAVGDFIIRPAGVRDAGSLAHAWKEFGRYYAEIDATEFRVPDEEGLPEWLESRLRAGEGEDASWRVTPPTPGRSRLHTRRDLAPAEDADRQLR
jgi:hypothetical protein